MKLRIIPQLIVSFLMLLLGSQAAKAEEVVSDRAAADTSSVILDFGVETTPSQDEPVKASSDSNTDKGDSISTNQSKAISSSSSASELFATMKSPGSIAVGAAEGNLTLTGKTTSLYFGHTDPGNHVTNRGFCSWNRAKNLSVTQADRRCLAALQRQAAATEQKLTAVGIDPNTHVEALVNGTDLWNQSNLAGADFAPGYKKALDRGFQGKRAYIDARVEAFRNPAGTLDASGLFGICNREAYYRRQLQGYPPGSESWRWNCIALDQGRRVEIVGEALRQNMGDTAPSPDGVQSTAKSPQPEPQSPSKVQSDVPKSDVALLLKPSVEQSPAVAVAANSPQQDLLEVASDTDDNLLDFSSNTQNVVQSHQNEPQSPSQVQPDSPVSNLPMLLFEPNVEQVPLSPTEQASNGKAASPRSLNSEATESSIDAWTSNLKKQPKKGDKIAGYEVTSPYGKRIHPIRKTAQLHGGVDLATPTNTNLYAIGYPGTQTTLNCWTDASGGGLVATMKSPSFPSLKFDALHLSWCKAPTNGYQLKVDAGGLIGGTGNTGNSTGPHLHFQIRDEHTGNRIPPSTDFISWVLTGKQPEPTLK
jgi:murein DD-endopeptidase MepM/ murein hydrolase activator NlpD